MLALPLLLVFSTPDAHALPPREGAKFGIGVGGGLGVSGLSGKFWLDDRDALQIVVGTWGVGRPYYGYGFGVGADYLFEMPPIAVTDPVILGWNLGLGGTVGVTDPTWVGASAVAGLEFNFQPVPIDVTLEYRPGMVILPGVAADLVNFTGHARVHF